MLRSTFQSLAAILLLSLYAVFAQAQGVITVRLSYKIILNPADGNRPTSGGAQVTDAGIDAAIANMNQLSAAYFRGFRFQRVDPVTNVGGMSNPPAGPSQYFNTDFVTAGKGLRDQIEAAAMGDAAYAWNSGAINIYINQGTNGGYCSFPKEGRNVIIVGAVSANAGNTQLHEIGHYFNLCHTHGCSASTSDDEVADTLTDSPMWDEDRIAKNSFPDKKYSDLSAGERQQVDDLILNLMSYHGTVGSQGPIYNHPGETTLSRLTEGQLDRWTDAANGPRAGVCDGTTVFAQISGNYGAGSSANPYGSVVVATQVAAGRPGNNIVMFRPGATSETITINPPLGATVTLRATRRGAVTIGQ